MTSRVLQTDQDRIDLVNLLSAKKLPMTVTVVDGRRRSAEQNKLQRKWVTEAADQLGEYTAEEYRAYCKLHFGVPILRARHEDFCADYDRVIRPMSYEDKLSIMGTPIDFPVTRLMTVKQKSEYLDSIYQHFRGLGVQLTEPMSER